MRCSLSPFLVLVLVVVGCDKPSSLSPSLPPKAPPVASVAPVAEKPVPLPKAKDGERKGQPVAKTKDQPRPAAKPEQDPTPAPVVEKKAVKVYSREEFRNLVLGKTPDEVIKAIGRPESTLEHAADRHSWRYEVSEEATWVVRDPVSRKIDGHIDVLMVVGFDTAVHPEFGVVKVARAGGGWAAEKVDFYR